MQVERLYRNEGGTGSVLVNDRDEIVGNIGDVWAGEQAAPVGAIVKTGSSRYPKFFLIIGV